MPQQHKPASPAITPADGNVFADIGFSPEEAAELKLRSQLMIDLGRWIKASGLTQAQAAEQLGVAQSRVSDLVRGKINLFSLDMLVRLVTKAGMHVELRVLSHAA